MQLSKVEVAKPSETCEVKKALAENIRKEKHKKGEYHQHRFQTDDDDDDDDDDEALSLRHPKKMSWKDGLARKKLAQNAADAP